MGVVKMVMYDGGSPGLKRLWHRVFLTGFPVRCTLVRVKTEGTKERILAMSRFA